MPTPNFLARGFASLAVLLSSHALAETGYWRDLQARPADDAVASLAAYRYLHLDQPALEADLRAALREGKALSVPLPLPDGRFVDFTLADSGTMPPELAATFPELLSLAGRDGEGRRVRVDISPRGLAAMVFDETGIVVIQPERPGGAGHLVYARTDHAGPREPFHCGVHETPNAQSLPGVAASGDTRIATITGQNRRVYRLAQAATGEYAAAVCSPAPAGVSCAMAAIVTTINRVNQVYENEVGVQLQLIANNNLLVYTNGITDPYTNHDGEAMLDENQDNVDTVIGSANYDVGHVFSTGGGGIAGLRVICNNSRKAEGVTGSSQPWNDPFDIDYVAHEMGHQFGGSHTFNGNASACGGNRTSSAAYEPGSGSTIQAYAGICGSQNLQNYSDPYFHAYSLSQIHNHITSSGGTCAQTTTPANAAPVIVSYSSGHTIPARTPFTLTAHASDANGDTLTYAWEQWDLGAIQTTSNPADNGTRPILRSYPPTLDPQRTFPRLSMLLNNPLAADVGELLPTMNRNPMKFRLTVRDNAMPTGASTSADAALTVVDTGQPFAVTAPGASPAPWTQGQSVTVSWNVAGTNASPISCTHVRIDLSGDGGVSFPHVLAASAPNTGSASIMPPGLSTSSARVRVACVGNVFFALSPANFTVVANPSYIFSNGFEN